MPCATAKTELCTDRLHLRWLTEDDAGLLLGLWNDPDFIHHVGDRGIRTLAEARQAMRDGVLGLYAELGYGPYLVEALDGGPPMGICGLFKRDNLDHPDIGYGLPQLKAIVSQANSSSVRLLEKLGMRAEGMIRMPGEDEDVSLYGIEFSIPDS